MKKLITLLTLVFACSLFVTAQSEQTGAANGPMSMTGCIAERDGHYMMMNKDHPDGVALMSSDDLKPHVGHRMTVTGRMMPSDQSSGSSMSSDESAGHHHHMAMRVNSMKMMSEHCEETE